MEAAANATPLCLVDGLELRVIVPRAGECEYQGTWTQLLAEGVVSAATPKPKGAMEAEWYSQGGRFAHFLRRKRLPGTGRNGRRAAVDWWSLTIVDTTAQTDLPHPLAFYDRLRAARSDEVLQGVLALGTPRESRIAAAALIARAAASATDKARLA